MILIEFNYMCGMMALKDSEYGDNLYRENLIELP